MKKLKFIIYGGLFAVFLAESAVAIADKPLCNGPMHLYNYSTTSGWKVSFTTTAAGHADPNSIDVPVAQEGKITKTPIQYYGRDLDKEFISTVTVTDPTGRSLSRIINNTNTKYGGTACPDFQISGGCTGAVAFNKHPGGKAGGDLSIGPFASFEEAAKNDPCWSPT
jgi:hypothetical protein